nr:hypothetical protein [Tanacetum cinerariifolium]
LRSSTKGSSNSKSVHTRVRTEVRHEVHVRTKVRSFVDKEENGNQYDNVPIGGLDHQSMDDVSKCMNNCNDVSDNFHVDGLDHQSMEGESLIVDDNDFKINDNEEYYFLSTQHVRELMEEVFDTPSGLDSTQDVGGSESMNVDQPYLVKNVKDVDESDIKTIVVSFQHHKFPSKVLVSPYVPLQSTEVKYKKMRRELKLNKSKRVIKTIVDSDGNEI